MCDGPAAHRHCLGHVNSSVSGKLRNCLAIRPPKKFVYKVSLMSQLVLVEIHAESRVHCSFVALHIVRMAASDQFRSCVQYLCPRIFRSPCELKPKSACKSIRRSSFKQNLAVDSPMSMELPGRPSPDLSAAAQEGSISFASRRLPPCD